MSASVAWADTPMVFPADSLRTRQASTLRQLGIAAAFSLVVHMGALMLLTEPDYETARIAGGGASFALSVGGFGEGADAPPASEAQTAEDQGEERAPETSPSQTTQDQAPEPQEEAPAPIAVRIAKATPPAALRPMPDLANPQPIPRGLAELARSAPAASKGSSAGKSRTGPSPPRDRTAAKSAFAPDTPGESGDTSGSAGSGAGSAPDGPGDAASTNYTGIVTSHIRRNRRSNLAGAGSVILKIGIAPSGRIEDIDIYRSSGSTRFDRQALRMAKMASPYPTPPAGQGPVLVRIKGS